MCIEDLIRHDKLVDETHDRLVSKGRYNSIQKYVHYRTKEGAGELDIVASNNDFINYYEMKIHYCKQSREHAIKQFQRYKLTHPLLAVRFIYVTPTRVERIRL